MTNRARRPALAAEAERINRQQLGRLGAEIRASRKRRRLSQASLGRRAGLAQMTVSRLERGYGGTLSVDTLQRVALALGLPLQVSLPRDTAAEPEDAGHLAVQELVLRMARAAGYTGRFELATRPAEPARSADVGLRHDARRRLVIVECWNTFGSVGAAARSFHRKLGEAEQLGIAVGREEPYAVRGCWVVRATRVNRALVARYPESFAGALPGSSVAWARALVTGEDPPGEPGLVWSDVPATRLFPWRRR